MTAGHAGEPRSGKGSLTGHSPSLPVIVEGAG
jgi:hypothetical protein